MTDPEEIDGRLAGLIERLRIDGYSGAADCLVAVRSTAYTTGE